MRTTGVSIDFDSWREAKLSADSFEFSVLLICTITAEFHHLVSHHRLWNGRLHKWTNRHLIVRKLIAIFFFQFGLAIIENISCENICRSPRQQTWDNRWEKVSKWSWKLHFQLPSKWCCGIEPWIMISFDKVRVLTILKYGTEIAWEKYSHCRQLHLSNGNKSKRH